MGETGNCHFSDCHTVSGWLQLIHEQVEIANARGARVEAVTWAPILTLGDFDWGKPAPGSWVTWDPNDPARRRVWDPDVARAVRVYTSVPAWSGSSGSTSTARPTAASPLCSPR